MSNIAALIMAAGTGERFESKDPKKFYPLLDRPMLVWAVERFAINSLVGSITVVVTPGEEDRVSKVLEEHRLPGVFSVVAGGLTRQESVWFGLDALPSSAEYVLIHDAARPCVTPSLIDRILDALKSHPAVVPVVPAVDTLIRVDDSECVDAVVDRSRVSGVQTPQGFHRELIVRAHRAAVKSGTIVSDDGSAVLALGEKVHTIPGERNNIKITYVEDAIIAEAVLGRQRW